MKPVINGFEYNGKRIMRVFPSKTTYQPRDEAISTDLPLGLFDYDIDEIHISVVFTKDLQKAEYLAKQWEIIAPVEIGGPATGMKGEEFTPKLYIRNGYTITSRGCPNKCWFCDVWKREGRVIRELEIKDGWCIQDDNLLACSDKHVKKVFNMLKQYKSVQFIGGLEAGRLKDWHIEELTKLNVSIMYFAYDTADDLEPLMDAGNRLKIAGFDDNQMRCYVLMGYHGDTFESAKKRLKQTIEAGFQPRAMVWVDHQGKTSTEWRKFANPFARARIYWAMKADGFPVLS